MPNDASRALAGSPRGLIVAPAGCGKTRLVATAVSHDRDRQLVLTHTHAGVRAILNHLAVVGVSSRRVRVTTIDSFALRYANAFPSLSGWSIREPRGDEWQAIHASAAKALQFRAVQQVLRETYGGLYVDEYQDCSAGQHALICALADLLPCRIVGDPLQSIFADIHKGQTLSWSVAEKCFPQLGELNIPYRWVGRHDALGEWLLDVRGRLLRGEPIELNAGCVDWTQAGDRQAQLAACWKAADRDNDSVAAICKWRNQAYALAGYLRNSYVAMETVECEDLQEWCERIESSTQDGRLHAISELAEACLSRIKPDVKVYPEKLAKGTAIRPRMPDRVELLARMQRVRASHSLGDVALLMGAYTSLSEGPTFKRRELWGEIKRSVLLHNDASHKSLRDTAWHLRDGARRSGRFIPKRCLVTTLLAKGLEFDHAIVLNLAELKDAENAYVAMTRGAISLGILSERPRVAFPRPACVAKQG